MKTQVVRAGKYLSVGIIVFSSLPVLFPLLFLLCVFGFVVVVPLGCTLVGFVYLRNYAELLYRKLSVARSRLESSVSAVYIAGHVAVTDPNQRDSQVLQTYEELDQEFDAILVSINPPLVLTPEDEIAVNGTGSGTLSVSKTIGEEAESKKISHTEQLKDTSAEGSETASKSSDSLFHDAELGEAQLNKKSEQSSTEEANDSLVCGRSSAESAEVPKADSSGGADAARDVASDFCILEEKGLEDRSSARDFGKLVEDTRNVPEIEEDEEIQIPQKEHDIQSLDEGKIYNRAFGNFDDTNVTVVDQGLQECHETPSPTETGGKEDGADQLPDIAADGSAEKMVKDRTEDGVNQLPDIVVDGSAVKIGEDRTEDGADQLPVIVVNGSAEKMVEDRTEDGVHQLPDIVVDGSAEKIGEDRTEDGADQQLDIVVDGSAEQMFEDRAEDGADQVPNIVVDGNVEKMAGGRKEDVADEVPDGTFEEMNEDKKEDEADALSNDVTVKEARAKSERHDDSPLGSKTGIDSEDASLHTTEGLVDHGLPSTSGGRLAGQEIREGNLQARPLDFALEKVDEDEDWRNERVSLVGVVKAPDFPLDLPVEGGLRMVQSEECPRSGALLPHQAHEDDIWICKECGWRYPNAKPSAKIRRNHKKHCKGRGPPTPPLKNGVQGDLLPGCHGLAVINKRKVESETSIKALGNSSPKRSSEASQSGDEFTSTTDNDQCSSSVAVIEEEILSRRLTTGALTSEQESSEAVEAESSSRLLVSSPAKKDYHENVPDQRSISESAAVDTATATLGASSSGRYQDAARETAFQSFRSMDSESFRSTQEAFFDDGDPCSFSSFRPEKVQWDDDRHQLAQVQVELQLRSELISMKEIVGDQRASAEELLLTEIHQLSDFLGIDLPAKDAELPDLEWARVAVDVMKIVVGVD